MLFFCLYIFAGKICSQGLFYKYVGRFVFPLLTDLWLIYIYREYSSALHCFGFKSDFLHEKALPFRFRLKLLSNITFLSYSSQKIQMFCVFSLRMSSSSPGWKFSLYWPEPRSMGEAAVRPRTTPTTTNSCLNTQNTSNSAVSSGYTKVARLYHDSYAAVSSCYECCQAVPQQLCSC